MKVIVDKLLKLGYSIHIQPAKNKDGIFGSVVGPKGIFSSTNKDYIDELLQKVEKECR